MRQYQVAIVQMDTTAPWEENLAAAERFIDEAAAHGASLVAFPECFSQYIGGRTPAEPLDNSPTLDRMRERARANRIWVLSGSLFTPAETEERKYNTSILISPEGERVARYDKLHLFDVYLESGPRLESRRVKPGQKITTVDTELGCLGMSVCYDLRFPELYRFQAQQGARVLLIPSMFSMETGRAHWESLIRARAIENTCYVVAPNQYQGRFVAYGHSMVVDPWGKVLCEIPEGQGIAYAEIDLDYLDRVREKMPTLKHCREDVYQIIEQ